MLRSGVTAAAFLAAVLAGACAGSARVAELPPTADPVVQDAPSGLSGVVLTGRHSALGDQIQLSVSAPDSAAAHVALSTAFDVADSIEQLMSLHVPGSEVNAINAAAGRAPVRVSPWTEQVVATILEWAEKSGGAFDPTVGPVLDVWGFGRSVTASPDPDALAAARQLVGWQKVRFDPASHTVFLTLDGMSLDLRAAYKGFALDRMREAMLAAGATGGIADIGGDVLFFGSGAGPDPDRWTISLPDPYRSRESFAWFALPPGSVSSSAALDRAIVIGGRRYGHLIDPRTGQPVEGLASVSTYAADGITSDITATALYVLGPRDGPLFVERWPGVEAVFVVEPPPHERSVVIVTSGLEAYRTSLDPPYRPAAPEE